MIGPYAADQIITGDARELARAIPDCSVDLIFTDPPYPAEFLPLYGWLAQEADRILKPDGFLLAYAGLYSQDDVMALMRGFRPFFCAFVMVHCGGSPIDWVRGIIGRHKVILSYGRRSPSPVGRRNLFSCLNGIGADKRFHMWGQDESTARYYIDAFSQVGDVVFDPFIGGGTTAAVCKVLDRRYLGFEVDPTVADIARRRVAETQMPLFRTELEQVTAF